MGLKEGDKIRLKPAAGQLALHMDRMPANSGAAASADRAAAGAVQSRKRRREDEAGAGRQGQGSENEGKYALPGEQGVSGCIHVSTRCLCYLPLCLPACLPVPIMVHCVVCRTTRVVLTLLVPDFAWVAAPADNEPTASPPAAVPAPQGAELVGKRIEVYWPRDREWYAGVVTSYM